MFGFLNSSLLARAGLAMGIITVLAIAGMGSAVYIARSTHGEAGAVNLAGSLRMLSYRITATLEGAVNTGEDRKGKVDKLIWTFEHRLHSHTLSSVIPNEQYTALERSYRKFQGEWSNIIKPAILAYQAQLQGPLDERQRHETSLRFQELIDAFVTDIDNMVYLLEVDAESSIHMLGLMQGISLLLTLLVAAITLYLIYTDVLNPLRDLVDSAERAGHGDFDVRVGHTGKDELGRLGLAFNTMTADLSKLYGALEDRVEEKTAALLLRNRSLELLYKASQRLTESPVQDTTYVELLEEVNSVLGFKGITLCIKEEDKSGAYTIAGVGPRPPMCERQRCDICLGAGENKLLRHIDHFGNNNVLSIAVKDEENEYGVLLVESKPPGPFQDWQIQVLETLGKHIGISIGVNQRVMQRRRLALLD